VLSAIAGIARFRAKWQPDSLLASIQMELITENQQCAISGADYPVKAKMMGRLSQIAIRQ
jgi:hypothetical protein